MVSDAREPTAGTGADEYLASGRRSEHVSMVSDVGNAVRRTEARRPRSDGQNGAERPSASSEADAWAITEAVTDPELPMLTLVDLGVLRDVAMTARGTVVVSLTPTYSGCPAMAEMRADVRARLHEAGYTDVEVRTVLHPPWSTDWISEAGRHKLAEHGIAPPGQAPRRAHGPVPLTLEPTRRAATCTNCGSPDTEELSEFSATACKALRRCRSCQEPFEHVKEF